MLWSHVYKRYSNPNRIGQTIGFGSVNAPAKWTFKIKLHGVGLRNLISFLNFTLSCIFFCSLSSSLWFFFIRVIYNHNDTFDPKLTTFWIVQFIIYSRATITSLFDVWRQSDTAWSTLWTENPNNSFPRAKKSNEWYSLFQINSSQSLYYVIQIVIQTLHHTGRRSPSCFNDYDRRSPTSTVHVQDQRSPTAVLFGYEDGRRSPSRRSPSNFPQSMYTACSLTRNLNKCST